MSLTSRAGFMGKTALLWAAMAVTLLLVLLGALGFFTAAFLLWLEHYIASPAALAITGGVLLLEGGLIAGCFGLALRRLRRRQPTSSSTLLGFIGPILRLVLMVVQRSPRKTMLFALIAGVLAEYFTTRDQTK